ncbi:MAG: esterase [Planctomycetaceae bacterium]|nr:esterase [Planctomycetaceae bacterium]
MRRIAAMRHRIRLGSLLAVTLWSLMGGSGLHADQPPTVKTIQTEGGVRFAVLGDKPAKPAPTLIVLAGAAEETLASAYFLQSGVPLGKQGYLCVSIDLPCHGQDVMAGEGGGIAGWRKRLEADKPLMSDLGRRGKAMLDYLVANGYTDVEKIAATGTSRGGFSALHLAAQDPRIRCVAAMAPVTDLFVVTEFKGMMHPERAAALSVSNLANELANRNVWLVIGDRDERVGTDNMIAFGRKLSAVAIEKKFNSSSIEIHVLAEPQGHTTPKGAAQQSATWIAEQLKTGG